MQTQIAQKTQQAYQLFQADKFKKADKLFQEVERYYPDNQNIVYLRGLCLLRLNKRSMSRKYLRRSLVLSHKTELFSEALANYIQLLKSELAVPQVIAQLKSLEAEIEPNILLYVELSNLYVETKQNVQVEAYLKRALDLNPSNMPVKVQRINALIKLNDVESASKELSYILDNDSLRLKYRNEIAPFLAQTGAGKKIPQMYEGDLESNRNAMDIVTYINFCGTSGITDEHLSCIEEYIQAQGEPADAHLKARANFMMYKYHHSNSDYDGAFSYLERANKLRKDAANFDMAAEEKAVEAIKNYFLENELGALEPQGSYSPIFIVGMPRSGSTLLERMISSHADVRAGGELEYFPYLTIRETHLHELKHRIKKLTTGSLETIRDAYLSRTRYIHERQYNWTDKMLGNFAYVGFMLACFPNASIINIKRDPISNCFSCYKQIFSSELNYVYSMEDIVGYYNLYDSMMDFWDTIFPGRVLHIEYEDVVSSTEPTLRKILDYCGLPWDDACLKYTKNKGVVSTASVLQVREGIAKDKNLDWQNYEKHIKVIIDNFAKDRAS